MRKHLFVTLILAFFSALPKQTFAAFFEIQYVADLVECEMILAKIGEENPKLHQYVSVKESRKLNLSIKAGDSDPAELGESLGDYIASQAAVLIPNPEIVSVVEPRDQGTKFVLMPGSSSDRLLIAFVYVIDSNSDSVKDLTKKIIAQDAPNMGPIDMSHEALAEGQFLDGSWDDFMTGKPVRFILSKTGDKEYSKKFDEAAGKALKPTEEKLASAFGALPGLTLAKMNVNTQTRKVREFVGTKDNLKVVGPVETSTNTLRLEIMMPEEHD